jgi:hypothetical protein
VIAAVASVLRQFGDDEQVQKAASYLIQRGTWNANQGR